MGKIKVICANPNCKKEFESRTDKIAKGQGKFCSRKCASEFHKGKPFSEERKAKLREIHNTPEVKAKHAKAAAKQLLRITRGTRGTPLEIKLCDELRVRKISFLTQQYLIDRYVVDILLRDCPIIIEADGSVHRFPRQHEKDIRRDKELNEAGYIVLRFTGSAIHHNTKACVDKVCEVIDEGVKSGKWQQPDLRNFSETMGDQTRRNNPMFGKTPWNKGLNAENNERMAKLKSTWKQTMLERGYWDKWRGQPRTKAPWENLRQDYEQLNSIVKVAKLYGVGKTTIYRQLKAQGIEVINKKPRRKISWDDLEKDYKELRSIEKVGKLYGASKETVKKKLIEKGIPLQKSWTRKT